MVMTSNDSLYKILYTQKYRIIIVCYYIKLINIVKKKKEKNPKQKSYTNKKKYISKFSHLISFLFSCSSTF